VEIVDKHFGSFGPTNLPANVTQDAEHKKFQACLFLSGTHKKYTKVLDEFNNSHKEYPNSAVDAVETISYRMDCEHTTKFKTSCEQSQQHHFTSFAQT